ncbi:Uncharacterized protein PCOAH_00013770 [Plasmodium coatneyi]|uniref:Uncharacterized protein n=1 Tax=Plasmodium coatneyi TaxID=208452 RepID=A0A1B1DWT0_9APIC|nr:Uncharacterized protein PCOAH_00013770 [Plasmodium coatneyi]ANQ07089.1 Uncharacterized protein PCOAH_00013770 [Plasmodium coatneyi]
MKVRKRSPLCRRNPQAGNDDSHDGGLLDEYYNTIPGIELQIEKILESFHVSKYDYKITHLLIDIIQNETIKILRNAKNIKKNGIDRRLYIKADPTKREDRKEDHVSPNLVGSSNSGDDTKKDDASKGMVEGQPRTDQSNVTADISNDASGANFKGGVIDDRATQAVSLGMEAPPANERDEQVEKQNQGNDIQADVGVAQTQEQSHDKGGLAELSCGVEEGTKKEAAGGGKEESQVDVQNGEEKKQVEAETLQTGQTEQNGQEGQTDQNSESFSIFKTFSSYFAKVNKPNEEEGESAPEKSGNDESKNREAIDDPPKVNNPQNENENVNPSDNPAGAGNHFLNDAKNNIKEETNDTIKEGVPHGMSSSGQNLNPGDGAGMAPNKNQMDEAGKETNQVGSGVSEEVQNGDEKEGAKDQAEQPQSQPATTTTTTEQEEVLVIDEESVNLAIKEYVLKYIYKKKNVDFLYDELATQQKETNSAGIVDRNVRYPTGFPPYLPDDCSINTILPAWDIKYNFNSSKGESYQ